MSRGTVLVADPIGGDVSVIEAAVANHGFLTITPHPGASWTDLAGDADALIVNLTTVDAKTLGLLKRCRIVARLGVGTNSIDLVAARDRGIIITNVPDYCREEVSDHALALILSLIRKLPIANSDVQSGQWDQLRYRPIRRVNQVTLGLIGYGRLSRALAEKAVALGMRVIAHDPYISSDSCNTLSLLPLDALLATSDVISLHAPLVPETERMIGATAFGRMKRGAMLVNTSRGELVDEAALVEALDSGHLAGAALDVLSTEPPPRQSSLRNRSNVILTPHMAFYSEESLVNLQRAAAEDVARVLSGLAPLHRVA